MATEGEHLLKASRNRAFLVSLDHRAPPDWVVTVAFYVAVHLVEALFARRGFVARNHRDRNDELAARHPDLWRQYRPLYSRSRMARYWCSPVSAAEVNETLARLDHLQQTVLGLLGTALPPP